MAKFKVWIKSDTEGLTSTEHNVEVNDSDMVRKIKELSTTSGTYVQALDEQGIEMLITPKRKASVWTAPLTEHAHQRFLDGRNSDQIVIDIFKKFDVEVTANSVTRTIKQESNAHFQIADGLREQVVSKSATNSGGRNGLTDEEKAFIEERYERGHSGAQIARDMADLSPTGKERNSSTVNTYIRENMGVGYRAPHKVNGNNNNSAE